MKFLNSLIFVTLLFCGCRKSSSTTTYMNTATIKGQNLTTTACGGAYWITIHGATDSLAQFNTLPAGSGIDLTTATFPINIKLNWHNIPGNACNVIVIDAMALD